MLWESPSECLTFHQWFFLYQENLEEGKKPNSRSEPLWQGYVSLDNTFVLSELQFPCLLTYDSSSPLPHRGVDWLNAKIFKVSAIIMGICITGVLKNLNKFQFHRQKFYTDIFSPLLFLDNTPQTFLFIQLSGTPYSDFVLHSCLFRVSFSGKKAKSDYLGLIKRNTEMYLSKRVLACALEGVPLWLGIEGSSGLFSGLSSLEGRSLSPQF